MRRDPLLFLDRYDLFTCNISSSCSVFVCLFIYAYFILNVYFLTLVNVFQTVLVG